MSEFRIDANGSVYTAELGQFVQKFLHRAGNQIMVEISAELQNDLSSRAHLYRPALARLGEGGEYLIGYPVKTRATVPRTEIHFRGPDGRLVGKLVNLTEAKWQDTRRTTVKLPETGNK